MKVPEPRKLKSGTWFIQMVLGGVSVPVSAPTKAECKRQATLIKAEWKAGKRQMSKTEITLEQAIDRYIAKKEPDLSSSTIRGYEIIKKNRFQSVMKTPLLKVKNWQEVYDEDSKRLSGKTMMNTWSLVKSACAYSGFTLPKIEEAKVKKTEHEFLEPEEIKKIVSDCNGSNAELPILLGLCSLRLSEMLALTWKDIDFKNNRINVSGATVIGKGNKLIDKEENKTEESKRTVPIFIPRLTELLKNKVGAPDDKLIPVMPNTVYRHVTGFLEAHGYPPIGVHGLRHSFASLAWYLQIPVLETCALGGWKDANTVIKVYTHLDKKSLNKYGSQMQRFYEISNETSNDPQKVIDIQRFLSY